MSKRKNQENYEKTKAFHFWRWLSGTKDPYLDVVEMHEQPHYHESEEKMTERMEDSRRVWEKVYNSKNKMIGLFRGIYKLVAVIMIIFMLGLLLTTVSNLPPTGEVTNPAVNEVGARYIERGLQETGSVNIVTGMILTYRAFDTFGETNVLFIATICVMILLMMSDDVLKKQEENNDRKLEPKKDPILQGMAFILVPIVVMFGIYVILNGHLSPGGGFSGGSVLGAGLILYVAAFGFKKTEKFFNEEVYVVAKVTALLMYGAVGIYYYFTGANGIESIIPLGIPGTLFSGGIIFFIDICVGVEVACTMYAFYALFRRGGL